MNNNQTDEEQLTYLNKKFEAAKYERALLVVQMRLFRSKYNITYDRTKYVNAHKFQTISMDMTNKDAYSLSGRNPPDYISTYIVEQPNYEDLIKKYINLCNRRFIIDKNIFNIHNKFTDIKKSVTDQMNFLQSIS